MSRGKLIAVNEAGLPIGEDHPRSKLSNAQVDDIRHRREDFGWGIPELARKFKVSKSTIHAIVNYKVRAQRPAAWKRVRHSKKGTS